MVCSVSISVQLLQSPAARSLAAGFVSYIMIFLIIYIISLSYSIKYIFLKVLLLLTYLLFLKLLYFSSSLQLFSYLFTLKELISASHCTRDFFNQAWPYNQFELSSSFVDQDIALPTREHTFCLRWVPMLISSSTCSGEGGSSFRFTAELISVFCQRI